MRRPPSSRPEERHEMKNGGAVANFDEGLWSSMAECVTVGADGKLTVEFRDGTRI